MEHQNSSATRAIPADVRGRIIDAANRLFEDAGSERFPSVADVRRLARTDMNATSLVMRDWKRQQSASKTADISVSVPETVTQAALEYAKRIWLDAQAQANARLRTAQEIWAVERAELEGMHQEVAQLFEAQVNELEGLRQSLEDAAAAKEHAESASAQLVERLNHLQNRAEQSETRAEEITRRASDLKEALERAHEALTAVRQELKAARAEQAAFRRKAEAMEAGYAKQLEQLQTEVLHCKNAAATALSEKEAAVREVERMGILQEERNHALQDAALLREHVAHLSGKLDAVQMQNADLLECLGRPNDHDRQPKR